MPFFASTANKSDVSGSVSLSSSGSNKFETKSASKSAGTSPAPFGSVPLAISSAFV